VKPWKVIFAVLVIFAAGGVTGGLLVRTLDHRHDATPAPPHPAIAAHATPASYQGFVRVEFLRRMERELDLTTGERERIDQVLKESQERTKQLMEPVAPQLRAEVQRAKDEFRDLLTPAQRARFDELLKQQQQRFREPHRPGGSRPHSPELLPTNAAIPSP
jgi:hypothetical protein